MWHKSSTEVIVTLNCTILIVQVASLRVSSPINPLTEESE